MPALSASQKAEMLVSSRGAAVSLLEDLEHIREVVARRETNRGEVRRLSAILRRLLVERAIAVIAAPRIGRITLHAFDLKLFYDLPSHLKLLFFSSGGVSMFGVKLGTQVMMNAGKATADPDAQARAAYNAIDNYDQDRRIELRLDNFLAQRVLCYRGLWASRGAIIKHVANVASGVHSGVPATDEDAIIDRMRISSRYDVSDGQVHIHMLPEFGSDSAKLTLSPKSDSEPSFIASSLDPVLIELLCCAQLLVNSPGVIALERSIVNELDQLGHVKFIPR